jgi:hypothetical protein
VRHLSQDRLLTLGLSPEHVPFADEAAHLAECRDCALRLEEELALSAGIAQLPQPEVPPDFVAGTTARFSMALESRRLRRTAILFAVLLLSASALVIPMVGILVSRAGSILVSLATIVEYVVTVGHALLVVLGKLPPVTVSVLFVTCSMALASSLLIGRLSVATEAAK